MAEGRPHAVNTGPAMAEAADAGRYHAAVRVYAGKHGSFGTAEQPNAVFLQVDAANTPALALYRRAGFVTAWTYEYWRKINSPRGH